MSASDGLQLKKVLFAFDGTPLAAKGLDYSIHLAEELNAELGIVTVVDPSQAVSTVGGLTPGEIMNELRLGGRRKLDLAREKARPLPIVLDFLREGEPAAQILATACEWGAELIVLNTRRHSRLARALCGSTSMEVMERAPCAVLIAPK